MHHHTCGTFDQKQGNQWYFGMKAQALLNGEEEVAAGDSVYSSNARSLSGYKHGGVLWLTPIKGVKQKKYANTTQQYKK